MNVQETIASEEELAPFEKHASQMAALDYIVCVESDVFVPSYSGNMARAVEGHRRFNGHLKTISPDRCVYTCSFSHLNTAVMTAYHRVGEMCRKELVALFNKLDQGTIVEGEELSAAIIELHKHR